MVQNTYLSNKRLYTIITPNGADEITCPICGISNENDSCYVFKNEGIYLHYSMCCNVMFCLSHVYISCGCTDDTYHSYFISKYKMDDIVFEGFPVFLSFDEFLEFQKINKIQILELKCNCRNVDSYERCDNYIIDVSKYKLIHEDEE